MENNTKPCPNCKELVDECACFRNKCMRCSNPVGNITFTVCDACWDKKSAKPTPPKPERKYWMMTMLMLGKNGEAEYKMIVIEGGHPYRYAKSEGGALLFCKEISPAEFKYLMSTEE